MGLVLQKKAIHGEAFFALEQTAGKGQMGRHWITNKGENLILSIVLETALLQPPALFSLNLAMSLAAYDYLFQMAGDECSIKWPNDLYWRDRKAGGILIESSWKGTHWQFAIVGMGINVNQAVFGEGMKNPVSLKQITGKTTDLMLAVQQLCSCLELRWQQLLRGETAMLLNSYNQVLYARNSMVQLQAKDQVYTTTVIGVNGNGELLTSDSEERKFKAGEVSWL